MQFLMDLMPCKTDGRDIKAEMTIRQSNSSEVLGSDVELVGGWYLK